MNCKIAGVNLGQLQVQEGCRIFELRRVLLVKVQLDKVKAKGVVGQLRK